MTEKERIEYGNMRYEQGFEAGKLAGCDADELWDTAYNEGYDDGEGEGYSHGYESGRSDGFDEGSKAEQKRIQTVIRMHMEWAKRDNKGRDFIFWNNVAETLTPVNYKPMTDAEWAEELEKLGF